MAFLHEIKKEPLREKRLLSIRDNISYFFYHEQNRTGDVDLDNNEQEYYDVPVLNKILKL